MNYNNLIKPYEYENASKNLIEKRLIKNLALIIVSIILYILGVIIFNNINRLNNHIIKSLIYIYGWIGIIISSYMVYSYKKTTGHVFSLYTIFCLFIVIFNYGQFILWAIGIHYEGELGTTNFIRYMDDKTLLKIEIITSISILVFHTGALMAIIKTKKIHRKAKEYKIFDKNNDCMYLKFICTILFIISSVAVIYDSYINLGIALKYGYTSLYYGGHTSMNVLLKYISYLFFPSMIGYLVGSKFSKKSFYLVCTIFSVYMMINLLAGDRGSWIYYSAILFWCYIRYIKKPSIKSIIFYILMFIIILTITSVLVKFREIGFNNITLKDINEVISNFKFIFIKPLFEMGQSARVLGIIIQDKVNENWVYGNTYIAAFASIIIPRMKIWLGFPDFYLENWISQSHLGLKNYGVGFSMVAEAYLNGGILFFPFIMFILGLFIGKLTDININNSKKPIDIFFKISSTGILLTIARGSIELSLRKWVYGVFFILAVFSVLKNLNCKLYKK
ncbi:Uncharacterised protein [[Clostridium] sordellii]|uniref:O-antigen polysaccharide polymerase Wzy n=1 Tax=Paraclostridium sordellii TaxID=1505 RepID=UPI0005E933F9|nr:O-antigen polysaccharide polymerase Wzy [Paeniclostridium sordellii]CEP97206.1 Uncharacterised protein [[Clostridium] sordellii] [Paeniclostridium sordellii]